MLKIGQRYGYLGGSGSGGKIRFIVEVTAIVSADSERGDVKTVQNIRWFDPIGTTYSDQHLSDSYYWTLLEGQDKPEA